MIDSLSNLIESHGITATMLIALCAYHFWWSKTNTKERQQLNSDHKEERNQWYEDSKMTQEKTTSVIKDNNDALNALTRVIADSNREG